MYAKSMSLGTVPIFVSAKIGLSPVPGEIVRTLPLTQNSVQALYSGLVIVLGFLLSSAVYGGDWTARTFAPEFYNRPAWQTRTVRYEGNGVMRPCPERANLDVKWVIDLSQPDDGTLDHVNPNRHFTTYIAGRDTPGCYVSQALGDHQKDWDYIVAWRDRKLSEQGIAADAPLWDKVAALANAAAKTFDDRLDRSVEKDDVVVGEHPVDAIIKGTWCVGESGLMIAVASTMGLEGRSLGMGDHTVCEIRVDGKWRYVENIDSALPHCLSTKSFVEFLADPDCDPEMPDRVKRFWRRRQNAGYVYGPGVGRYWQFKQQGGTYQVALNPENAHALYPSLAQIPTIMNLSRKTLNEDHRGLEGVPKDEAVKVGQDSGVRKCFYLSSVPESLSSTLFLNTDQSQNFPSDGGDWVLDINGNEYPLRDLEGFGVDNEKMTLPLPVASLRAGAENVVALRSTSSGDEYFSPKLYYDFLMPAATFYYDPAAAPKPVVPTVSAIVPPAFVAETSRRLPVCFPLTDKP